MPTSSPFIRRTGVVSHRLQPLQASRRPTKTQQTRGTSWATRMAPPALVWKGAESEAPTWCLVRIIIGADHEVGVKPPLEGYEIAVSDLLTAQSAG